MNTNDSSIVVLLRAARLLLCFSLAAFSCKLRAGEPSPKGQPPQAAASICCIPEYFSDGTLSTSPSFWVSNQTSKPITVTLEHFLFLVGTNWIAGPPGFTRTALMFQTPRGRSSELQPYEAAYGEAYARPLALPVGQAFRVQACIGGKLAGLQELGAKAMATPQMAELRLASGNTNIPYHAFGASFYSSLDKVVTPEVLITNTPVLSPRSPTKRDSPKPASPEDIAKARAVLREAMTNSVFTAQ